MREIKFRGFCNLEKKMYQNFYIEDHAKFAFINELINSARQRYTLMQYTGLKDANHQEVYEGDILIKRNYGVQKSEKYVVEWVERSASFSLTRTFKTEHKGEVWEQTANYPLYADECKVVGNIYENPELIGVSK